MFKSFITLACLATAASSAAIKREASQISCGESIRTGSLWYGDSLYGTYDGQLGINKFKGLNEVAKYPGQYVANFDVYSLPCNSTYLNLTTPSPSQYGANTPVKLALVDDPTKCLALSSTTKANAPISVVDCSNVDDESQNGQFWTQAYFKYNTLYPIVGKPSVRYNLQFESHNLSIANPPNCYEGQTCQDSQVYSFIVKVNN